MAGYALKLKETTAADITTGISIDNGSMLVEQDSARVSFDLNGNRITIDGIIYLNTDAERTSLLAPINNKIYYVRETKKLWAYSESSWVCINGITASDIKTTLGVSATGDSGKYLNERGEFTAPAGGSSGVGHSIFEIFYSLSSSTPPGAMDLSLGTLITSCNTLFPDFWDACIAQKTAGTIRCLTEAEWQAELTANGSCGAFVIDDDTESEAFGSVRLPKINDYLRSGTDTQIGTYLGDAIRNITGESTNSNNTGFDAAFNVSEGALNSINTRTNTSYVTRASQSNTNCDTLTFDASRAVPTADENRPKTVYAKLYIQVYTATVPASTAQAAEFVNALEGKAGTGLEGLTTTGAGVIETKAHNRVWVSTAQTIANSTSYQLTHNLNLTDDEIKMARCDVILQCIIAQYGYVAGEWVHPCVMRYVSGQYSDALLAPNVSQDTLYFRIALGVMIMYKTSNSVSVITPANWEMYFRIFY